MGYPFVPISLFPKYDLEMIMKMECDMAKVYHCLPNFNDMSFFEFSHKLDLTNKSNESDKTKNFIDGFKGMMK